MREKYLVDSPPPEPMLDGLTGLWNRASGEQRLAANPPPKSPAAAPLACVMMDADEFQRRSTTPSPIQGGEVLGRRGAMARPNAASKMCC